MKHAGALVRKLWKQTGETIPLQSKDHIGAIHSYATKHNSKRFSLQLRNNIILYDQFATWLCQLATVVDFTPKPSGKTKHPSYKLLVGAISSLSLSIRYLVVFGHDIGAK